VLQELNGRFNQPLICLVAALIGFATLLTGAYSRFGVWRQIVAAFFLLILVKLVEGLATEPVRDTPEMWPLIYFPSFFGLAIAAALLAWAGRSRRRRPRGFAPEVTP